MKTLFGIRSNVAVIAVGSLYLLISLHISIHELKYFEEYKSVDDGPSGYLLIDTNSDYFHITSLTLSLSCLLSSLLLILGVFEKRYGIIRPWLAFNCLLECVLISISLSVLSLMVDVYESSWLNVGGVLVLLFCTSIATIYHAYLWNGTYSLYEKFQKVALRLYRVPDEEDTEEVHTV